MMTLTLEDTIRSHFKVSPKNDRGDRFQAFCPAHDDKNASLSVKIDSGRALIFCHAGCQIEDILKSANLTFNDLFSNSHRPIGIYQYRNYDGTFSHEKLKFKTETGKTFKQRHIDSNGNIIDNLDDVKRIPYNYPEVIKAIKVGQPILYCEGEKDANTGKLLGFTSTTMGGASDWKDEFKTFFKNATIIQIPDKDDPGLKLAHNVTESLKTIAKSLKVIILPGDPKEIKDLTNWVEHGNKDLKPLITDAPELVSSNWLDGLKMSKTNSGYSFKLDKFDLEVRIERLTPELESIIKVLFNSKIVHTSKINLLAPRTVKELTDRLKTIKDLAWPELLSDITNKCSQIVSDAGEITDICLEPLTMEVEYLLSPILPLYEPSTIYTAGGKGKSIFADFFSVLIAFGVTVPGLPFTPKQANVLYLDWEAEAETHRRYINAIKRGLGITSLQPIYYRNLEYPLAQVIDSIKNDIEKWNIGFIIIDSQMAATASGTRGMTEAQVASEYYNLLRSLHCTTLTIDHITKQSMSTENGTETPYGSIVKYNRSRSQFELRLDDDYEDSDDKVYALVHRKFNLGRKIKPIGITVNFENDGDELVSINFSGSNVSDSPKLAKTMKRKDRIIEYMREHRNQATLDELAKFLGEANNDHISMQLSNDKKTFHRIETGLYGLVTRQFE